MRLYDKEYNAIKEYWQQRKIEDQVLLDMSGFVLIALMITSAFRCYILGDAVWPFLLMAVLPLALFVLGLIWHRKRKQTLITIQSHPGQYLRKEAKTVKTCVVRMSYGTCADVDLQFDDGTALSIQQCAYLVDRKLMPGERVKLFSWKGASKPFLIMQRNDTILWT